VRGHHSYKEGHMGQEPSVNMHALSPMGFMGCKNQCKLQSRGFTKPSMKTEQALGS